MDGHVGLFTLQMDNIWEQGRNSDINLTLFSTDIQKIVNNWEVHKESLSDYILVIVDLEEETC